MSKYGRFSMGLNCTSRGSGRCRWGIGLWLDGQDARSLASSLQVLAVAANLLGPLEVLGDLGLCRHCCCLSCFVERFSSHCQNL